MTTSLPAWLLAVLPVRRPRPASLIVGSSGAKKVGMGRFWGEPLMKGHTWKVVFYMNMSRLGLMAPGLVLED